MSGHARAGRGKTRPRDVAAGSVRWDPRNNPRVPGQPDGAAPKADQQDAPAERDSRGRRRVVID